MRDRRSGAWAGEQLRGLHPHAVADLMSSIHLFAALEALRSPVLPSDLGIHENELQEHYLVDAAKMKSRRGRDPTLRPQVYTT